MKPIPIISLPFPSKLLGGNAKGHWSKRHTATKKARNDAYKASLAVGAKNLPWKGVRLQVSFYPPDRRRRDRDNLISRFKPLQDGIADAVGIDDYYFRMDEPIVGPPTPNGRVDVLITPIELKETIDAE